MSSYFFAVAFSPFLAPGFELGSIRLTRKNFVASSNSIFSRLCLKEEEKKTLVGCYFGACVFAPGPESSCTGGTMQLLTYLWFHIGDRSRTGPTDVGDDGGVVVVDWDRSFENLFSRVPWCLNHVEGLYPRKWWRRRRRNWESFCRCALG